MVRIMKTILSIIVAGMAAFSASAADNAFTLESSTFTNGGPIPARCAMKAVVGGQNISPALSWKNPPAGTKSFVITCIDKHPMARNWVHWMLSDIPANAAILNENVNISKAFGNLASEYFNSFGERGWSGPMPPIGSGVHKYVFTVYALSGELGAGFRGDQLKTEAQLLQMLNGKILGKASITGTFER